MVFDTDAQANTDRKKISESIFAYLNRSAKRGSAASRALIEEWLFYVPKSEQDEFCARFRSGDNIQFATAFQELFLHEFLRRQKCMLDFHPGVPGSSKRPDFLVRIPDGDGFILEARTSTDVASGPESNPRGDRIRDALRDMKLDGHKLGIDELTVGTTELPQKALRKHIVDAIATQSGNADGIVSIPNYSTLLNGGRLAHQVDRVFKRAVRQPPFNDGHARSLGQDMDWAVISVAGCAENEGRQVRPARDALRHSRQFCRRHA